MVIKKENYPEQQPAKRLSDSGKEIYRLPGHTIYLLPTVMLANLLPCDLHYYIKGTTIKGTLKPGKEAMLHGADTSQNMELGQRRPRPLRYSAQTGFLNWWVATQKWAVQVF